MVLQKLELSVYYNKRIIQNKEEQPGSLEKQLYTTKDYRQRFDENMILGFLILLSFIHWCMTCI